MPRYPFSPGYLSGTFRGAREDAKPNNNHYKEGQQTQGTRGYESLKEARCAGNTWLSLASPHRIATIRQPGVVRLEFDR